MPQRLRAAQHATCIAALTSPDRGAYLDCRSAPVGAPSGRLSLQPRRETGMVRQSQDQERNGREDGRQQFPFEGLHVYQRAQEAWLASLAGADDPLGAEIEREIHQATIGIARVTAR